MASTSDVTVRDNPAELRYEARRGDSLLGQIRYRTEPGLVVLVHTDVATSVEGSGVGSALVAGALDDISSRGLRVVPVCPFVAAYIRRHPRTPLSSPRIRRPRTEPAGARALGVLAESMNSDLSEVGGQARLRIVQCHADPALGRQRRRMAADVTRAAAHARIIGDEVEDWRREYASFERLSLAAPSIDVDTSDGLTPNLEEIVAFVNDGR